MEWYYAIDNQQIGPVSEDEFKRVVNEGIIKENTLVWNQSMDNWIPFSESGYVKAPENITPPPVRPYIPESEMPSQGKRVTEYNIKFTGIASEYFKIWIVNLFFTIITLGIYAAWAKVRTRQYIYANSSLAGDTFDFLGNPVAILRGNIIIAIAFGSTYLIKHFKPEYAFIGTIIFYLFLPFLIYKSMQFLARNSAWRNVRFTFSGSLKESYFILLIIPLIAAVLLFGLGYALIGSHISKANMTNYVSNIIGFMIVLVITFYILGIYIMFRLKKYFFSNMSYGQSKNIFSATASKFYGTYTIAGALYIGGTFAIGMIVSMFMFAAARNPAMMPVIMVIIYIPLICFFLAVKMFIYTKINNYCWSELTIDNVKFKSNYETMQMAGIMITNILAIIFSLGLMIPWAKIRMTKYKLENIKIYTDDNFENFIAASSDEVSAIGDAAMDAFDFDISL